MNQVTLHLREKVSIAETEDGTVLLDEQKGRYWQLNASAGQVLRVLLDRGTVEDAAADLAARYPVSAPDATRDVTELVDQLRAAGLLVPAPDGGVT
jgi:hypothetical protein